MPLTELSPARVTFLCENFRVLSDENRMRVVLLLRGGERCVCDIVDSLGLPQSLVSHHLAVLRSAGLLSDRRSGKWVYYSIDKESVAHLNALLADVLNPDEISVEIAPDCEPEGCCGPTVTTCCDEDIEEELED